MLRGGGLATDSREHQHTHQKHSHTPVHRERGGGEGRREGRRGGEEGAGRERDNAVKVFFSFQFVSSELEWRPS